MFFAPQAAAPDRLADRIAQVRTILISPSRHVALSGRIPHIPGNRKKLSRVDDSGYGLRQVGVLQRVIGSSRELGPRQVHVAATLCVSRGRKLIDGNNGKEGSGFTLLTFVLRQGILPRAMARKPGIEISGGPTASFTATVTRFRARDGDSGDECPSQGAQNGEA